MEPSVGERPVEFSLGRWPGLVTWIIFGWSLTCVVYPSIGVTIFKWPLVSGALAALFAAVILRNSSWSPFYLGPTLRLDATGVSGRGGWFQPPWHVSWPQVDRAEWGRNGVFVYRNDVESWRRPCMQVGPFGYWQWTIADMINARARMARQAKEEQQRESSG
jgi:hypothetical protein